MRQLDRLLIVGIIIGLLGACASIARRVTAEARNRTVDVAIEYADVVELAGMFERDVPSVLADLKAAGLTSVAVYEDSLESLVESGRATTGSGAVIASLAQVPGSYLATNDMALATRVHDAIARKIAPEWGKRVPAAHLMPLPLDELALTGVGLGFPEEQVKQAQAAGLSVVARPLTYPLMKSSAVEYTLWECARLDMRTLVFAGSAVMGYRDLVRDTALLMPKKGLAYGLVEMGKQFGDASLGWRLGGSVVRVHSIPDAEMAGMSPGEAVTRFVRGVKERGIRLCYVRLFGRLAVDPYQAEMDYLRKLSGAIAGAGFTLGRAEPPRAIGVPLYAQLIIAVGVIAGVVLLLRRVLPVSDRLSVVLMVLGLLVSAVLVARGGMGPKALALLAALTFPTMAVHALSERLDALARARQGEPKTAALVGRAAVAVIACSAVTVAGGLMIAGMLASTVFMTHVDQFAGVKFAHALPLLAIAATYAFGLWRQGDEPRAYWERVARTGRGFLGAAITNGYLILAVAVIAVGAVLILRSGNEPGLDVSGLELRARQLLEDVLVARPRTKEFLVGHPLLMLAPVLAAWGWRRWLPLCVIGGAVGQVSLLNTFCHIHTPFIFSVIRSVNGLWLGVVLGALLVLVLDRTRRAVAGGASDDAG